MNLLQKLRIASSKVLHTDPEQRPVWLSRGFRLQGLLAAALDPHWHEDGVAAASGGTKVSACAAASEAPLIAALICTDCGRSCRDKQRDGAFGCTAVFEAIQRWLAKNAPPRTSRTKMRNGEFRNPAREHGGRACSGKKCRGLLRTSLLRPRCERAFLPPSVEIKIGNDLANNVAIDRFPLQSTSQRQRIETEVVDITRNAFAVLGDQRQRPCGKQRRFESISRGPQSVIYVELPYLPRRTVSGERRSRLAAGAAQARATRSFRRAAAVRRE